MEKTLQPAPATRAAPNSCASCKFCGSLLNGDGQIRMVCRRNAPRAFANAFPASGGQILWATNTAWPGVNDADWCGEFSPAIKPS